MYRSITILTGCLSVTLAPLFAQNKNNYPAPEVSTIMVSLDKLPIDTYNIQTISYLLTTLSKAETNGNEAKLRNRAQMLALSLRLDSNNKLSAEINRRYKAGETGLSLGEAEREKALRGLDGVIQYLSKAEAGSEAHVLANYLKDVLKGYDGNNSKLADHVVLNERWKNVIPARKKYEPKHEDKLPPKLADGVNAGPEPLDAPDDTPEPPSRSQEDTAKAALKWGQKNSRVVAPIYFRRTEDDKKITWLDNCSIWMEIKPIESDTNEIEVDFLKGSEDDDGGEKIGRFLEKFIKKQGQDFPSAEITLKLPNTYSRRNGTSALFPLALEVQASLTGKKMLPNVIVIGRVDESGKVRGDYRSWSYLKKLREYEALEQILVCPLETKRDYLQLIALEESNFFIRNEVIGVKSVQEAINYTTETDVVNIRKAHEMFLKLQQTIGTRSVGQYASNKKVRELLKEILELNPNHISAEMILLRGDIKRAKRIEDKYVGKEVEEMRQHGEHTYESDVDSLNSEYLSRQAEKIKKNLELVEKYIDSEHDELIADVEKLITELSNMSRSRKKDDSDYHQRSAENAHDRFKVAYKSILKKLESLKE